MVLMGGYGIASSKQESLVPELELLEAKGPLDLQEAGFRGLGVRGFGV